MRQLANPHTPRCTKSLAVSQARCYWGGRITSLDIACEQKVRLINGFMPSPQAAHLAGPIPWQTFGQQAPNSLLISRDPVAIDCMMCDLLRAEWGLDEAAYDYLRLAETRGLGVFERGDPWSAGYQKINYLRVDLPAP